MSDANVYLTPGAPSMPTESQRARAHLAKVRKTGDPTLIREAQQDLAAARIKEFVSTVVAAAPPLRPEQTAALAALLSPRGGDVMSDANVCGICGAPFKPSVGDDVVVPEGRPVGIDTDMARKIVRIPPPEKRLTVPEVQARLGGISRRHLYRMAAEGKITVYKAGSRNLYDADELEGLISRKTFGAVSS